MNFRGKNFKHKHSLGQNFIIDEFLLEDIADESHITKDDYVLEIGPGNGALTRCLLDRVKYVIAVEIDRSLIPLLKDNLKDYDNATIINADFLNYDFMNILDEFSLHGFNKDIDHIKVVANLPYYITSMIIHNLLINPYISEMTLMVQKEVAERIVATHGGRDYGILTLSCEYFAKTELLMVVSKECFMPIPKVDSAVVHFVKYDNFIDLKNNENFHIEDKDEYKKLFSTIKASFSQRRKKLINSLSNVGGYDKTVLTSAFTKLNFDESVRAEDLSLEDYRKLSNLLS